jgi:rRNA small subunit pseudouridine methyltransferase Nep1
MGICGALQVVKGPVTKYFPAGAERVGFSHKAELISGSLQSFVKALPADQAVVFSVGAMARGKIDVSYTDRMVSISEFALSAACCLGRITNALEWKFDIV